jgi:phosphopantetheine adenylyltransferase
MQEHEHEIRDKTSLVNEWRYSGAEEIGTKWSSGQIGLPDWWGGNVASSWSLFSSSQIRRHDIITANWHPLSSDTDVTSIFANPPSIPITTIPSLRPPGQHIIPAPYPHGIPSSSLKDGKYPVVALGGTFDHLHAGHKILLSMAVWITGRKLIVGISGMSPPFLSYTRADQSPANDLLVSKAHSEQLEPLQLRIERTREFLHRLEPTLEYELVELRDVAGPTGTNPDVQALVVSRESASGGDASEYRGFGFMQGSRLTVMIVAAIRKERNLPPLDVYVIDVISSSADSLIPIADGATNNTQDGNATSLVGETDQQRLKEGKMSSSYIRKWLAEGGDKGESA